jgi:hypothetical protein
MVGLLVAVVVVAGGLLVPWLWWQVGFLCRLAHAARMYPGRYLNTAKAAKKPNSSSWQK